MKKTKNLIYLVGSLLVIFTIMTLYQLFRGDMTNSFNISLLLNLVLDVGFLYYAYKFSQDTKLQQSLAETLNKPASDTMNKKLPVWLIIYGVILVGFILYFNFAGKI